jgi:hypothetical protein
MEAGDGVRTSLQPHDDYFPVVPVFADLIRGRARPANCRDKEHGGAGGLESFCNGS